MEFTGDPEHLPYVHNRSKQQVPVQFNISLRSAGLFESRKPNTKAVHSGKTKAKTPVGNITLLVTAAVVKPLQIHYSARPYFYLI